jgi:hypothetical protein
MWGRNGNCWGLSRLEGVVLSSSFLASVRPDWRSVWTEGPRCAPSGTVDSAVPAIRAEAVPSIR